MPAHPKAFLRLTNDLRAANDRVEQDRLLDLWLDFRDRATEWDAARWGLEPDGWTRRITAEHERETHGNAAAR